MTQLLRFWLIWRLDAEHEQFAIRDAPIAGRRISGVYSASWMAVATILPGDHPAIRRHFRF
jgi:hypothetical protein